MKTNAVTQWNELKLAKQKRLSVKPCDLLAIMTPH